MTDRESVPQRSRSSRPPGWPVAALGKLRLLAVLGLALSACSAAAQALPEDQCAQLEDPEAEIVCLRAALAATRQARPAEAEPRAVEPARAGAPAAAATVAPSARAGAGAAAELGREQVARAADAPRPASDSEALVERIADFRTDRTGALIMQLENGQIWRQVEDVDLPLRLDSGERPEVEITRSGFGGYRMHFPAMNRTVSVARIR